jgi:hypothetical protein
MIAGGKPQSRASASGFWTKSRFAHLIHLADAPQHGSAAWIGGQATDP